MRYMSGYTPIMTAAWPYFADLTVYTWHKSQTRMRTCEEKSGNNRTCSLTFEGHGHDDVVQMKIAYLMMPEKQ